ncbi:hypothetical protein [Pseudactinotalea terrae]|uniref:hypothetical protein n=1 Tax=Pseudactinotalea terrae TaxID=1743262 RepID=UPI0012E238E7|nr:hypothetical protein [Pseudactinotalea terrae]
MTDAITTTDGTTVRLAQYEGHTLVLLEQPDTDLQPEEAGRILGGAFQPVMFCPITMTAEALEAIATITRAHVARGRD